MVIADLRLQLANVESQRDELQRKLEQAEIHFKAGDSSIVQLARERDLLLDAKDRLEEELATQSTALETQSVLLRNLRDALVPFVRGATLAPATPVDLDSLAEKVAARLGVGRPVLQVVPVEALKHRFQQEAVARLTLQVQALEERPRQAILWLLAVGRPATYKEICSQLGFPEVGGSYTKFRADIKEAVDIGLLTTDSHGLHVAIRNRVANELAPYGPPPEEIEATYQHLLAALAGAGEWQQ